VFTDHSPILTDFQTQGSCWTVVHSGRYFPWAHGGYQEIVIMISCGWLQQTRWCWRLCAKSPLFQFCGRRFASVIRKKVGSGFFLQANTDEKTRLYQEQFPVISKQINILFWLLGRGEGGLLFHIPIFTHLLSLSVQKFVPTLGYEKWWWYFVCPPPI